MRGVGRTIAACLSALAVAACDAPPDDARILPELPWAREALPPVPEPADNPTTPEKIHLGWLLFHDPILSIDRAVACVTCHGQIWGLGDGLALAVGVDGVGPAGTGRHGPNVTRRNSQSLWNAGQRSALFWDGRAASLEAQVGGPLGDPVELGRGFVAVVDELATIPEYVELFGAAFPDDAQPVRRENLERALAAYQRTLVSDRAPYDRYALEGDEGALSDEGLRGMWLFAELGCHGCHAPPLFASDRYEPMHPGAQGGADLGRGEVTGLAADDHRVRVPSLRNARDTEPFFFDGSEPTLRGAVTHAAPRALSDDELDALVEFLAKGLTDVTRTPPRAQRVPSGLPVPIDGYSVPR